MEVLPALTVLDLQYQRYSEQSLHSSVGSEPDVEFGEFTSKEPASVANNETGEPKVGIDSDKTQPRTYSDSANPIGPPQKGINNGMRASMNRQAAIAAQKAQKLGQLPVSSGDSPLVAALFKPSEEFKALIEECKQLLDSLEVLENSKLLESYDQVENSQKLVKRIGFELKLVGNYKSLPEFESYTDLNVRCFNLLTKAQILKSKQDEPNLESAELSPEETGLIKTKQRLSKEEGGPGKESLSTFNSKIARRALRVAQTIRNATRTRGSTFQSLAGSSSHEPINRIGTAVAST